MFLVFSLDLKAFSALEYLTSRGREFQIVGPAIKNTLLPSAVQQATMHILLNMLNVMCILIFVMTLAVSFESFEAFAIRSGYTFLWRIIIVKLAGCMAIRSLNILCLLLC